MSYVDDMKKSIESALDQSTENLNWIDSHGPGIVDTLLNVYLATVPKAGWMVNPIAERAKAELARAVSSGREAIALMRSEVQFVGSPDNLRAAAETIDSKMSAAARALARNLVLGKIESAWDSNYSDGVASEGSRMAIAGRDAAVRDVETYASPVAEGLRALAHETADYYKSLRDLAVEFAGLVISIVAVVVGWETIVIGVLGVIGIVISLVAMGFTIADLISSTLTTTDNVRGQFESKVPSWPAVLS